MSFYVDGRIRSSTRREDVTAEVERVMRSEPDAVVGELTGDGVTIAAELVVSSADLRERLAALPPGRPCSSARSPPATTTASTR